MSVKQENEAPTSPASRTGKRSWTKLIRGGRLAQARNLTTSQHSQVGIQHVEIDRHGAGETLFNTSSGTSSQGPQDHKTPRVAGNPLKATYSWFRVNNFRPTWLAGLFRYSVRRDIDTGQRST